MAEWGRGPDSAHDFRVEECHGPLTCGFLQLILQRSARRARSGAQRGCSPHCDAFKISQRPADVEDCAVPRHWESDLILGSANRSAVGTLVERSTGFTILLHLPVRHDADSVTQAMIREMGHLPEHLRRSITWDRGTELAVYERIQHELAAPILPRADRARRSTLEPCG